MPNDLLAAIGTISRENNPLVLSWPMPGNATDFISFATFREWMAFVMELSLDKAIPSAVAAKFERAQKLYLFAWADQELIKAGELVGLTALELALRDRYGGKVKALMRASRKPKRPSRRQAKDDPGDMPFRKLLAYMVENDGLADSQLPLVRRAGGTVVPLLTGGREPSLADIRNGMAHGDPFDGLPWPGLLELIRDLIHYAFRGMIAESTARGVTPVSG